MTKVLFLEGRLTTSLCLQLILGLFLIFPSSLGSKLLRRSATCETTCVQSLFYRKSSPNLLVSNQIYINMLHYFIILF